MDKSVMKAMFGTGMDISAMLIGILGGLAIFTDIPESTCLRCPAMMTVLVCSIVMITYASIGAYFVAKAESERDEKREE